MRVFGIICLSEYLKQLRFIMLLQKYSDHFCLEEDGADMPVGQLWCWTFLPYKKPQAARKKDRFHPVYYICIFVLFRGATFF